MARQAATDEEPLIRPFDGSLADAEGLLAVERVTFGESPYRPEEVQAMLAAGGGLQRAWLALQDGRVLGFVVAFLTHGLRGPCWEVDLLAVHPAWQGCGLAARLIRAAAAGAGAGVPRARAVVALDNRASAGAFLRAGFRAATAACHLLIYRLAGGERFRPPAGVAVRQATGEEAASWLDRRGAPPQPGAASDGPRLILLAVEQPGQPAGHAGLLEVQTLLYRGIWIEALEAPSRRACDALIAEVLRRAAAAGSDEVGAMVPAADWRLQKALLAANFCSFGSFRWFTAELPLPEGDVESPAVGSGPR